MKVEGLGLLNQVQLWLRVGKITSTRPRNLRFSKLIWIRLICREYKIEKCKVLGVQRITSRLIWSKSLPPILVCYKRDRTYWRVITWRLTKARCHHHGFRIQRSCRHQNRFSLKQDFLHRQEELLSIQLEEAQGKSRPAPQIHGTRWDLGITQPKQ